MSLRTDSVRQTGRVSYAWLIDPLPTAEFDQDFYEQRLCLVQRAVPTYYESLLSRQDLDTVLGTHRLRHPEVNLVRGDDDLSRSSYTDVSGRIDPREVAKQFDDGATVIFTQLHKRVPALARLCVSLGQSFGARVQTNVYLTPPDAQGFVAHWDTHDVFVLQVEGRKLWSVYDTKVALPLKGQGFDPAQHKPGQVTEQFELSPGSLVYIPRGLMHSARSTTEASLHITLGLTAFTWTDFLLESVAAAALEDESLRQNLPRGFASENFSADEKVRLYREKLSTLLSRVDTERVWRRFKDEVLATNTPLFTDLIEERLRADRLTLDSLVTRRADVLVELDNGTDFCAIRFCGQEIRLPSGVFSAVEFATTADEFRVRDLPDCVDSEGKVTLVSRLVKEGLLQRPERTDPGGS